MQRLDLTDIAFCETDTSAVETEIITEYERIAETSLYPGDPVRLFLESVAYVIARQRFLIDYAGKMNLLHYSSGDYLDHLGDFLATGRDGETYASATMEFSLAEALDFDVFVPAGSRISTSGGDKTFIVDNEIKIAAGALSGSGTARCAEPGPSGNGLLPGQVNRMVDLLPHVVAANNTDTTAGGLAIEDDERLRERVRLAPERFSTAGPADAYRWWAMAADGGIMDVGVWSPTPGEVCLAPLMTGGEAPSAQVITKIYEVLFETTVRPLTDKVSVAPPEAVSYDIQGTYYILHSHAKRAGAVNQAVGAAVKSYVDWQRGALGRSIRPTELSAAVQNIDGIQRVDLIQPAYRSLDPWQWAVPQTVNLIYGGLIGDN